MYRFAVVGKTPYLKIFTSQRVTLSGVPYYLTENTAVLLNALLGQLYEWPRNFDKLTADTPRVELYLGTNTGPIRQMDTVEVLAALRVHWARLEKKTLDDGKVIFIALRDDKCALLPSGQWREFVFLYLCFQSSQEDYDLAVAEVLTLLRKQP